jgi:hypothetical protein
MPCRACIQSLNQNPWGRGAFSTRCRFSRQPQAIIAFYSRPAPDPCKQIKGPVAGEEHSCRWQVDRQALDMDRFPCSHWKSHIVVPAALGRFAGRRRILPPCTFTSTISLQQSGTTITRRHSDTTCTFQGTTRYGRRSTGSDLHPPPLGVAHSQGR